MKTTTRQHGTECHTTKPGADRIAAFRRIVDTRSMAKIDGVTVDLWTASIVVAVHDALSETNRANFTTRSAGEMARLALQLAANFLTEH